MENNIQEIAEIKENAVQWQTIKMKILTPVHIGSGEKLQKAMDIYEEGNDSYLIEWDKIFEKLIEELAKDFTDESNPNEKKAKNKLNKYFTKEHLKKYFIEDSQKYFKKLDGKIYGKDMHRLVRNNFSKNPIIPGSSLKGWLRTLLFRKKVEGYREKGTYLEMYKKYSREFHKMGDLKFNEYSVSGNENKLLKALIGDFETAVTGLFRVPDIEFSQDAISWYNSKVLSYFGGWKDGHRYNPNFTPDRFTQAYESLKANAIPTKEVKLGTYLKKLHPGALDNFIPNELKNGNNLKDGKEFWQTLFKWNNEYMEEYLKNEVEYYKKVKNKEVECANNLLKQCTELYELVKRLKQKNTSTLIRLGQGMGFHYITGEWIFIDHIAPIKKLKNRKKYKTRKIFFQDSNSGYSLYLPGFVLLTPEDEFPENKGLENFECEKETQNTSYYTRSFPSKKKEEISEIETSDTKREEKIKESLQNVKGIFFNTEIEVYVKEKKKKKYIICIRLNNELVTAKVEITGYENPDDLINKKIRVKVEGINNGKPSKVKFLESLEE